MDAAIIVLGLLSVSIVGYQSYLFYRVNKYLLLIINKEKIIEHDSHNQWGGSIGSSGPISDVSQPGQEH